MDNLSFFYYLLKSDSEKEIDEILRNENLDKFDIDNWKIFGGDDFANNKALVHGQNSTPEGALIEKLTNSVDALLLKEAKLLGDDPISPSSPQSVAEAVQKYFDVEDGDIGPLLRTTKMTELAENIQLFATGAARGMYPCITIVDKGEGQSSDTIESTFLSLAKTNKTNIPFVQGMFNQGGTATLRFSGKKNINLIATRKHPQISKKDNVNDEWCFTIIRKFLAEERNDGNRQSIYYYLAPKNKILTLGNKPLKILTDKKGKNPYTCELEYGSVIKLYNYSMFKEEYFNQAPRLEIENHYSSMPLPARISDSRSHIKGDSPYNNIYGVWIRNRDTFDGGIQKTFIKHPEIGNINCKFAIYPFGQDERQVKSGIFLTLNGQVHGEFRKTIISNKLNLPYLSKYLRIDIDGSILSDEVRDDLITTARDRLANTPTFKEIEDALIEEFKNNNWLKDKNAEIKAKVINQKTDDTKLEEELIRKFIMKDPYMKALLKGDKLLLKKMRPDIDLPKFKGKKFPSFFNFKNNKNELTKHTPINMNSEVQLFTDVENDYFNRARQSGSLLIEPDLLKSYRLQNGVLYLSFFIPNEASVDDQVEIKITISDVDLESKGLKPFINRLIIIPDSEKKTSGGKTTKKTGKKDDIKGTQLQEDEIGIPKVNWLDSKTLSDLVENFNEYDAILPLGDEWFGNQDNPILESLMTEARDKGEDKIAKRVFSSGLLYLGITLKREAELFEGLDIDIDDIIRKILRANSGFIVPIANLLSQYINE